MFASFGSTVGCNGGHHVRVDLLTNHIIYDHFYTNIGLHD